MDDTLRKTSDTDTIRRIVGGDVNAFETLFEKYKDHVLRIVKKHTPYNDVEEVSQDVFVRAYKSLPSFRFESDFANWLSSIAVKTCYDYWRKAYRSREIPISSLSEKHQEWLENVTSADPDQQYHENTSQEDARELLDWALSKLSAEDRIVLELVHLEGLSGKEAAKLLGWSVANVKVRSFRSRKKLQKMLKDLVEN